MPLFTLETRKVFFVHIPKTAGSSLYLGNLKYQGVKIDMYEQQGNPCTAQHYELGLLEQRFPDYRSYSPFAILRDPWSRTCSEFQWSQTNPVWSNIDTWLDRWLCQYLKNGDTYILDNHLRPQKDFVADHVRVFVLDRYDQALSYVEQVLQYEFDWSVKTNCQVYDEIPSLDILSTRVKRLWYQMYQADIDLYLRHLHG